MKYFKQFTLSFLAVAATAASAATQTLSPVTTSYVTLNTSVLATNSFTASALGSSTYNSSTGKLTDAVASATTATNPGALTVVYDNSSGVALKGSLSGLGVTVNMTGLFYNASNNTLYSDLVVNTALGSVSYADQAILVASNEVGTLGTDSINSVTTASGARALNMTLSGFTLAADLSTKLGSLATNFAWLPNAVTNVTVTSVPEPSTYALMGLGLVGIAFSARRKQQA